MHSFLQCQQNIKEGGWGVYAMNIYRLRHVWDLFSVFRTDFEEELPDNSLVRLTPSVMSEFLSSNYSEMEIIPLWHLEAHGGPSAACLSAKC